MTGESKGVFRFPFQWLFSYLKLLYARNIRSTCRGQRLFSIVVVFSEPYRPSLEGFYMKRLLRLCCFGFFCLLYRIILITISPTLNVECFFLELSSVEASRLLHLLLKFFDHFTFPWRILFSFVLLLILFMDQSFYVGAHGSDQLPPSARSTVFKSWTHLNIFFSPLCFAFFSVLNRTFR